MNKVLVSDYDGTFYIDEESMKKNIEYVKRFRECGNIFIFATGRSYSDFMKVKDKYNLEYDYLILNHGATILDSNNILLNINTLNKEYISSLRDDLRIEESISNFCCSTKSDRTTFDDDDLIKVSVKYSNTNLLRKNNSTIKSKYKNIYNSFMASEYTLEIVSNNSSKLIAIDFIKERLSINDNNIYTVGNGDSDIEMINKYNGFIVGDYNESLKKYDNVYELIYDIMNERV